VADRAFAFMVAHRGDGGMFVAVRPGGFGDQAVERFGDVSGGVAGRDGFGALDGFVGAGFGFGR